MVVITLFFSTSMKNICFFDSSVKQISTFAADLKYQLPMKKRILWCLVFTFLCVIPGAFAQGSKIAGTVRDVNAKELQAVRIHKKGTVIQTLSDQYGKYQIAAAIGDTLVFALDGYLTAEYVATSSLLDVVLRQPSDAKTGGAVSTTARTATSIYGSSKPLWVLNGVILEDDINLNPEDLGGGDAKFRIASAIAGLNADDIESFGVLKDGSAVSIYGPRAIAGVIWVKTRKGAAGKSSISYTNETTYRLIPSYRDFNILNSQGHISVLHEMMKGGHLSMGALASAGVKGVVGRMYEMFSEVDATGKPLLENTLSSRMAYLGEAERRNTDWFSELYQHSLMHKHSLSLSSGTDRATYYASISALFDPGWMKTNNATNYTATLNANYKITDRLRLNLITNAFYSTRRDAGDYTQTWYALNTARSLSPTEFYTRAYTKFNIFHELENNYRKSNTADIKLQGQLTYNITDKLEFSTLASIRYQNTSRSHYITEQANSAEAWRAMSNTNIRNKNTLLYTDPFVPGALPITVLPEGGFLNRNNYQYRNLHFRSTLGYDNVFASVHHINALAGLETTQTDREDDSFKGYGIIYGLGDLPFYTHEAFKMLKEQNENYYSLKRRNYRNASFFGNLAYDYKGKYELNLTLRTDKTNSFAGSPYIGWIPTWNVGLGWNVHDEAFFPKNNDYISYLTLKASYGMTGREPYVLNSLEKIAANIPWRGNEESKELGLYIEDIPNHQLTYEKNYDFNFGVAMGLLRNKINLSVDWYKRNNKDLIGAISTQGLSGYILKYGNVASMKSEGIDISLQTENIKTKDFSWRTTFVYSKSRTEVTELFSNDSAYDMARGKSFGRKGYPIGALFSFPFMGLNSEGFPTFKDQDGNVSIGNIRFSERNKVDYLTYSGTTLPTDVGSINNTFTYKGLSFGVFVTYSFGNVVRLKPFFSSVFSEVSALGREIKNRWAEAGDEAKTNIPVIPNAIQTRDRSNELYYGYEAYNYSDVRIGRGDFIRLKEISVGYDFDQKALRKIGLTRLSFKLQADNLFLLYADKRLNGDDPEYLQKGSLVNKQVVLSVRVGF